MIDQIDFGSYSVDDLKKMIARINKEIQRKEKSKIHTVRVQIEQLADHLGMTVEEILSYDSKKQKPDKITGKAKYQNPANPEQTWAGRGKRPRWLQQAVEKGAKLEQFTIHS